MKEINATFKKRKQNLLRQREKKRIIRNGKFVRGSFLNETYEGGRQATKSGQTSSVLHSFVLSDLHFHKILLLFREFLQVEFIS